MTTKRKSTRENKEQKDKNPIELIKDAIVDIARNTKDTPYALVSSLMAFVIAIFIIFGSSMCSLSDYGRKYCWLGTLLVIAMIVIFAFIITWKTCSTRKEPRVSSRHTK